MRYVRLSLTWYHYTTIGTGGLGCFAVAEIGQFAATGAVAVWEWIELMGGFRWMLQPSQGRGLI